MYEDRGRKYSCNMAIAELGNTEMHIMFQPNALLQECVKYLKMLRKLILFHTFSCTELLMLIIHNDKFIVTTM